MTRKLTSLFEALGAKGGDAPGRLTLPGETFGVESLFGGALGDAEVEVLSDEAFVFKNPPEMVGIGPLWVAGLDGAAQLKSAVKDAHARLKTRLTGDQQKLEALGMKPKLQAPEPVAAADLAIGGHVATVTLDASGALLVTEVSGRRVPQKSQQLGVAVADATADHVRGSIAELVQKMQRAGLLTGRGMFDAATVRGPYAADGESKEGLSSEMASKEEASLPSSTGATALASAGEEASTPKPEGRRVPRPKRRSTEDSRSSTGAAARSSTGAAVRSSTGAPLRSSTGAPIQSATAAPIEPASVRSTTGAPITSQIQGDESLLPSPAVDVATTRPAPPRSVTLAKATSNSEGSSDSGKVSSNPFGKRSLDTGVNVGFAKDPSSELDPALQASGFEAGQETGIGDALLSVPENSEEELAHALEDFSSDEDSSEESGDDDEAPAERAAADDDAGHDPLSDTSTAVHESTPPARTAEAPGGLAVTAVPDAQVTGERPGLLSDDDDDDVGFDDDGEHTAIAAPMIPPPEKPAAAATAPEEAPPAKTPSTKAAPTTSPTPTSSPTKAPPESAPLRASDDKPTDKVKAVAKAAPPSTASRETPPEPTPDVEPEAQKSASLDAAWRAAETAAKGTMKPTTTSDVPLNFDIDASTGEHPRTVSAEQTFNALQGVVGEGLSTGKTGAFILDAEAFAYLRGEAASGEIETLEAEIAALEARLGEARSRLVALKAGQLRAAQEAETTAPKGRLAEKKKRLMEERGRSSSENSLDLPSLASEIEPMSNTGPVADDDDERQPSDPGVALADVARALADEAPRPDATQMVAANYSNLDAPDDGDVFDSRQEETGAVGVDISMNSLDGDALAGSDDVDAEGETRVAELRSVSGAQQGPIGIVVADARALDRLTRHLEEQFESISGLAGLPAVDEVSTIVGFRALVLVRPKADRETFARLEKLAAHRRRPQVLCLSTDAQFDGAKGIDLRVELAKKAGEVAQQVIDGLKKLGVSSSARA